MLAQLLSKDALGIAQFGKGERRKRDAKKVGFVAIIPGVVRCGGPVSNLNAYCVILSMAW